MITPVINYSLHKKAKSNRVPLQIIQDGYQILL